MQASRDRSARAAAAFKARAARSVGLRLSTAGVIALSGGLALALAASLGPLAARIDWPRPFDAMPDMVLAAVIGVIVATLVFWPLATVLGARRVRRARQPLEALAASLVDIGETGYPRLRRYGDEDADAIAVAVNKLSARLHARDAYLNRPVGERRRPVRLREDSMAERVVSMLLEASPDFAKTPRARETRAAAGDDLPSLVADIETLARAGDRGGLAATANEIDRAFNDLSQALATLKARG